MLRVLLHYIIHGYTLSSGHLVPSPSAGSAFRTSEGGLGTRRVEHVRTEHVFVPKLEPNAFAEIRFLTARVAIFWKEEDT